LSLLLPWPMSVALLLPMWPVRRKPTRSRIVGEAKSTRRGMSRPNRSRTSDTRLTVDKLSSPSCALSW
jgi:hypothetical protein